jgi:hypothetical protein
MQRTNYHDTVHVSIEHGAFAVSDRFLHKYMLTDSLAHHMSYFARDAINSRNHWKAEVVELLTEHATVCGMLASCQHINLIGQHTRVIPTHQRLALHSTSSSLVYQAGVPILSPDERAKSINYKATFAGNPYVDLMLQCCTSFKALNSYAADGTKIDESTGVNNIMFTTISKATKPAVLSGLLNAHINRPACDIMSQLYQTEATSHRTAWERGFDLTNKLIPWLFFASVIGYISEFDTFDGYYFKYSNIYKQPVLMFRPSSHRRAIDDEMTSVIWCMPIEAQAFSHKYFLRDTVIAALVLNLGVTSITTVFPSKLPDTATPTSSMYAETQMTTTIPKTHSTEPLSNKSKKEQINLLTPGVKIQDLYLRAYEAFMRDEKHAQEYSLMESSYNDQYAILKQASQFRDRVGEGRFPSISDAHERIKAAGIRHIWHAEQLLLGFGVDPTFARAIAASWAHMQEAQHGLKSINVTKQGTSFESQKAPKAEAATPTAPANDDSDDEPETITSMGKYMSSSIYMTDVDAQLRTAYVSFDDYKSFMHYPDDPEEPSSPSASGTSSPPPPPLPTSSPPPTPSTKHVSFGPSTTYYGDGQVSHEQYDLAYALQSSLDLYQRTRNAAQLSEAAAAAIRRQMQAMAKNRPYRGRRRN